jgi:excisionase family DNA binding protein
LTVIFYVPEMSTHGAQGYSEIQTGRLLSEPQVRARLGGISRMTLTRIRDRGELPAIRIGRRRFFDPADVKAYIDRNREEVRPSEST